MLSPRLLPGLRPSTVRRRRESMSCMPSDCPPHVGHDRSIGRPLDAMRSPVPNVKTAAQFAAPFAGRLLNGRMEPIVFLDCVESNFLVAGLQAAVRAFDIADLGEGVLER